MMIDRPVNPIHKRGRAGFSPVVMLSVAVLCFAGITGSVIAQEQAVGDDLLFFSGEDLFVVSASRFTESVKEAPAIIEVVSSKEIRLSGARTIAELLRWHAGWHIIEGRDSKSLPFVRGIGGRHPNKVLVMVNGTPYKDGFYQDFIYDEYFPLEIIERIELIRGPGSVLFGSNALAGVINIITRTPKDLPESRSELNIKGGSRQTLYLTALAGSEGTKGSFTGHVRWFQSDNEGPEYSHRGINNIDEAGFRKKSMSAGFNYTLKGFYVAGQVIDYFTPQIVESDRQYLGNNGGWSRYNFMGEAGYRDSLMENLSLSAKLYWQYYDNNSRWGSAPPPYGEESLFIQTDVTTETERYGGELQAEWSPLTWMRIVAGADYELNRILEKSDLEYHSEVDTDPTVTLYAPTTDVYETGFFLQDTIHLLDNRLAITLGGRLTNNELFGDFFTPRGGVVVSPTAWFSMKVLYGEAFRSPNARELFTDSSGEWTAGNPDLKPEEIRTVETQMIFRPIRNLDFSITYCDIETKNDIEEAEDAADSTRRQWSNLEGTKTTGFEFGFQYERSIFSTFANVSLYEITDLAADDQKKFVPETMWNLGISIAPSDDLQIVAIWNHVGERKKTDVPYDYFIDKQNSGSFDQGISYDDATLGGNAYDIIDMTLNFKNLLGKPFLAGNFSVYNMLDEHYSDFPIDPGDEGKKLDTGYLRQGRNFLLSLIFSF